MNRKQAAAAIGGAVLVLGLAGCGTTAAVTGSGAVPPVSATAPPGVEAADPVPMIRQAGAVPDPGTRYGTRDVDGWRSAEGTFPGTGSGGVNPETILVRTLPGGLTGSQAIAAQPGLRTDDNATAITGPYFCVAVRPAYDSQLRRVFPVSPAVIAHRLGGWVVPG